MQGKLGDARRNGSIILKTSTARRSLATTSPTPGSPRSARARSRPGANERPDGGGLDRHARRCRAGAVGHDRRQPERCAGGRRPSPATRSGPSSRSSCRAATSTRLAPSIATASCASRPPRTRSSRSAIRGCARTRRTSRSCSCRGSSRGSGRWREVHPGVIEDLFASDLAFLQDLYRRINQEGHQPGGGHLPGVQPRVHGRRGG